MVEQGIDGEGVTEFLLLDDARGFVAGLRLRQTNSQRTAQLRTQTDTDRHRQTQTDTDRHRQTQTDTEGGHARGRGRRERSPVEQRKRNG